jgi:hypothetical protein
LCCLGRYGALRLDDLGRKKMDGLIEGCSFFAMVFIGSIGLCIGLSVFAYLIALILVLFGILPPNVLMGG